MSMFDLGGYKAELILEDINFTSNLKKAEKDIESTHVKSKGFASTLGAMATGAIAGVGIALIGAAGAAIKFGNDFDSSLKKAQAQLGLTEQQAKQLGDVAENVWKKGFGDSLESVTKDLEALKQNIGDTNEPMDSLLQSALTLKQTFGTEVSESARTASVLMKNFGISGKEAFDIMTVGFQKGGNFSDELLDTLREYSPQFKSMGLNANQMLGILIKGAQNGAFNLDKVGDAVKEFNIRAQDGSTTTAQGFKAIGLDAQKMGEAISKGGEDGKKAFMASVSALASMKDPLKQNQAGVALFGTQWEDVRKKVIFAMADGVKGIQGVDGATQKAGEALNNNLGNKLDQIGRSFQSLLLDGSSPFVEGLNQLADTVLKSMPQIESFIKGAMGQAKSSFESMKPVVQSLQEVITAFVELFETIWSQCGSQITAIAKGLWDMQVGILKNAIGIITGIVQVFVGLFTGNWQKMSQGAMKIWNSLIEGIKGIVMGAWNVLDGAFGGLLTQINNWFVGVASQAIGWGRNIIEGLVNGIENKLESAKNAAMHVAHSVKDAITNFFDIHSPSRVMEEQGEFVTLGFAQGIANKTNAATDAMKEIADQVISIYKEIYEKQKEVAVKAIDDEIKALDKAHSEKADILDKDLNSYEDYINQKLRLMDDQASQQDYVDNLTKTQKDAQYIMDKINLLSLDNSIEAKSKREQLARDYADKKQEIDKLQTEHERDLRKRNLQDQLDAYKKDIESKKNAENDKYNAAKDALDQQKQQTESMYDNMINDERHFAQIREQIMSGHLSQIQSDFSRFGAFLNGNMQTIGQSISQNLIDKMQQAIILFNQLQNMPIPQLQIPSSDRSVLRDDGSAKTPDETGLDNTRVGSDGLTDYSRSVKNALLNNGGTNYQSSGSHSSSHGSSSGGNSTLDRLGQEYNRAVASGNMSYAKQVHDAANAYRDAHGMSKVYDSNTDTKKFDTGGYTGEFSGGKWAILHSKELVLNQMDTFNLLKIVDSVRSIMSQGQLALNQANSLNRNLAMATSNNQTYHLTTNFNVRVEGGTTLDKKTMKEFSQYAMSEIVKGVKKLGGSI